MPTFSFSWQHYYCLLWYIRSYSTNNLVELSNIIVKPFVDLYPTFYSPGSSGIKEWSIIELQGELESKAEEALGGKLIGDLHYNHDVRMKVYNS